MSIQGIQAFVLIETAAGMMKAAIENLGGISGVKSLDIVTGPYDLIAVVEAGSFSELQQVVEEVIRLAPGVAQTVTCVRIRNVSYEEAA